MSAMEHYKVNFCTAANVRNPPFETSKFLQTFLCLQGENYRLNLGFDAQHKPNSVAISTFNKLALVHCPADREPSIC